ncbi:MAG: lipoyl synthase [Victivallales bacterium]|jgi:lipoic acid synthetase|nr:lipoyl synthase [Victivallales bacterium]
MRGEGKPQRTRLPEWLKVRFRANGSHSVVAETLRDLRLNTVCSGALCPNMGECFCSGTATFLIMGNSCTRNCKFCAIDHNSHPALPEADEPERLAEAAARLKLDYVVITSVTRDDLADGGAGCFAAAVEELHRKIPGVGVEVLTPDFNGDREAISTVLSAGPTVFNHNIETVERLSSQIRNRATYRKSLEVLRIAHDIGGAIPVKSGIMLGLGEKSEEVVQSLKDLREVGVSIVTIGQYLPPSAQHWQLDRFVTPEEFEQFGEIARQLGFSAVASSPLVRSSYRAGELHSFRVSLKTGLR